MDEPALSYVVLFFEQGMVPRDLELHFILAVEVQITIFIFAEMSLTTYILLKGP
jgi:hypothetical protein